MKNTRNAEGSGPLFVPSFCRPLRFCRNGRASTVAVPPALRPRGEPRPPVAAEAGMNIPSAHGHERPTSCQPEVFPYVSAHGHERPRCGQTRPLRRATARHGAKTAFPHGPSFRPKRPVLSESGASAIFPAPDEPAGRLRKAETEGAGSLVPAGASSTHVSPAFRGLSVLPGDAARLFKDARGGSAGRCFPARLSGRGGKAAPTAATSGPNGHGAFLPPARKNRTERTFEACSVAVVKKTQRETMTRAGRRRCSFSL